MLITRQELTSKGKHTFKENIIISPDDYKDNQLIISVDKLEAFVTTEYISSLAMVNIHLVGKLTLRSTRSLKPVPYKLDIKDELIYSFTDEFDDDENIIRFEGDELFLDPHFYSLMIASLPLKVIAEDDKDVISGDDWEIITEDEYYNRQKDDVESSPFASLLDLDLED